MTEFELYSLSYEAVQIIQAEEGTFFTLLFGYLLAAHYLGEKISKIQLIILNCMYLATVFGLVFNMWIAWGDTYRWLRAAETGAIPELIVVGFQPHIIGAITIYIALVMASLYFMVTVRKPKTE